MGAQAGEKSGVTIRSWPERERPREKLARGGAAALSSAELLALVLGGGSRGQSALDLARTLLARFGGVRGLLDAERRALCAISGMGPARYSQLKAVRELGRRSLEERLERRDTLTNPALTRRFLRARLTGLPHELFCCLYLDNRNRVIHFAELFRGTIDGASVHPREVVKDALAHNAAAVILAHNHPSGIAEPSQADQAITRRLRAALALVDIRVLDHIVVGDAACVSFAERGLL